MLIPYEIDGKVYNMIPCPSGSFIKGSNALQDDKPLEEKKIEKSFLLGETEITQELYQVVMNVENPNKFKDRDKRKNPVENVSWYDAVMFCNRLSDIFDLDRYYTITKDGKIIDTIKSKQDYVVEMHEDSKGFRLPTEWEWEYAAKLSLQKSSPNDKASRSGPNASNRGIVDPLNSPYPWASSGNENIRYTGNEKGKSKGIVGMYKANFKNGTGDYMGMSGKANDGAALPSKVNSFNQSPLNIYNIRGNVNEWVLDLYRPMSTIDVDDFNPYRANAVADGDDSTTAIYQTGINTLISNKSRVYKGGSWKDGLYWLNPGTRRFLDQDKSNNTIGFRCAISAFGMDNTTKPENGGGAWNWIKEKFNIN